MKNNLSEMRQLIEEKIKSTPLATELNRFDRRLQVRLKPMEPQLEKLSIVEASKMVLDQNFALMKVSLMNAIRVSTTDQYKIYLELAKLMDSFDREFVRDNMKVGGGATEDDVDEIVDYYMETSPYIYDRIITLLEALVNY